MLYIKTVYLGSYFDITTGQFITQSVTTYNRGRNALIATSKVGFFDTTSTKNEDIPPTSTED